MYYGVQTYRVISHADRYKIIDDVIQRMPLKLTAPSDDHSLSLARRFFSTTTILDKTTHTILWCTALARLVALGWRDVPVESTLLMSINT